MVVVGRRAILRCWENLTSGLEITNDHFMPTVIIIGDNEMEALAKNQSLGHAQMERQSPPSIRQLLEGMTLTFDACAAGDLQATIQFDVSAPQAGTYYMQIADRNCTFHIGQATSPTLTITTPSDVWVKVASGELNAQHALMQGLYKASGEFSLLLKMGELFKQTRIVSIDAPREQRPAGPIAISGMAWMTLAFIPVTLFWILFNLPVNPWISIGLPLLLSIFVVAYRLTFDRPTWLEVGICFFCASMLGLEFLQIPGLARWGGTLGSLAMAAIWQSSLIFGDMPVSAEYVKWSVVKPLRHLSLFIHPNAVISLMWGWQFLAAAALGMASILCPPLRMPLIIAQYGLIVPASWFTAHYQKCVRSRRIANVERAMTRIRTMAALGLGVMIVMTLVTLLWL
jgi:putative sterol carrier protein